MPAPTPLPLTRRATIGAAVVALAATGCDLDPRSTPPSTDPSDDPSTSGTAKPGNDDSALVSAVRDGLGALLALVARTQAAHAALGPPARPLVTLHSTHLTLLDGELPVTDLTESAPRPKARSRAASAALRSRERRLQSRLVDWSVDADSGALARLLASMAAAVAQQLAVWPASVEPV